jgi:pyruvate/2-oxoglutarate dehydrogenase complex dihydrolipoamide dehydrogenase (E3) component
MTASHHDLDVAVIGGGQSGLATGYFLRRTGLRFAIFDDQPMPGGAWLQGWESLRLFSPAQWSSLPGWPMPAQAGVIYPGRAEVIDYLQRYETRYRLPMVRPFHATAVTRDDDRLLVHGADATYRARAVVGATGSWRNPVIPPYPGRERFAGTQLHSAHYRSPQPFVGQRVMIVGGGNSGAQILAEVSQVADTLWVTEREPALLPDDVDGQVLFEQATERWRASLAGRPLPAPVGGFGDIVMVPTVVDARARGVLRSVRPPETLTADGAVWRDGTTQRVDAIVWCTGFRPALDPFAPLGVVGPDGHVQVTGTRSAIEPRLWLVGYGEWTGFASATLVGVMRTARSTAQEIGQALAASPDTAKHPVPY